MHFKLIFWGEYCLSVCHCSSARKSLARLFVPIDSPRKPRSGYGLDALGHRLHLLRYSPGHSLPMKLIATLPRCVDLWSRFVILRLVNIHAASRMADSRNSDWKLRLLPPTYTIFS
jgi:hypothetical protein